MKKLLLSLTIVIGMIFGSVAQAEPIEKWEYSVEGYFINWTVKTGTTGTIAGAGETKDLGGGVTGHTQLNWGNLSPRGANSGITIDPYYSGENYMYTNEGIYDATTLTHRNETIAAGSRSLSSVDVYLEMTLTDPDSDFTKTFGTVLKVQFYETNNNYNAGDVRNNDIFVVLNMSATSERFADDEGNQYEISFADPWNVTQGQNLLTALPAWAQQYVTGNTSDGIQQLPSGYTYYGFVTEEWNTTSVVTKVRIDSPHAPTPEPGTMLLMGFGLAGLGYIARKRRK